MKIILMGIQGSGKSTQGNLLSKNLNLPYLSTGHIFRDMTKEKSKLGRYLKETMNAGFLIPDQKTVFIVKEYLSRSEYEAGFILDGFPRTLYQAKKFDHHIDRVFYLKVSDKEALWRLSYRNDVVREDETLKAVRKRIELFHKFAEPVFTYYRRRKLLIEVNGEKPIKEVNQQILKYLKK
ncbi:nucleoside monophosphate kinase [Candidatus Microgenomates bacterium]|nr:nucleoside monophosphate kinase [Candidatus Microgenomates bacterium]